MDKINKNRYDIFTEREEGVVVVEPVIELHKAVLPSIVKEPILHDFTQILQKKKKEVKQRYKTTLCKYFSSCKNINNCQFAHSIAELDIPPCKFGQSCKNGVEKCRFYHSEEDRIAKLSKIRNSIVGSDEVLV